MGACQSTPNPKVDKDRSDEIDQQLQEDSKKSKKECKILLLGSGESGKSTIVKQMKILHKDGFTDDERLGFRSAIYDNLYESGQAIARQLGEKKEYGLALKEENKPFVDLVMAYEIQAADPSFRFSPEIAQAMAALWKDPATEALMLKHASDFYLMDSASYFFDMVSQISAPDYVPSTHDVLRARKKTSGIHDMRFSMGQQLSIHMFDVGGQRSERKKWIHCFEGVTSIIFCTALSEYDQVLLEAQRQNRMDESLDLFQSIINSRWFLRTSIILFLNKIDVFKQKLPKVPLDKYFTEYTGGADVNKAAKYILWRFMQLNKARLSLYPHLTQATDTNNVKIVFAAVKETILQNALKDSGIL
ncbi:hypothetical protein M422DRAFT_43853 [Sphaerobolus stellatus SS14]|nr:hypothetical protein M422DRAFT_43853 [Sphaerobolus stellatus SS14]